YHENKLERGFQKLINIWGADHHGYVGRMKAAIKALGYSEDVFEVVIGQMVNLLRAGEPVRMSKRTGEMVTLEELLDEVGKDALRFLFLMRGTNSALDFDIELAKKQSSENPVYYVQYAHARICSIIKFAREKGFLLESIDKVGLSSLKEAAELDLIRKLAEFEDLVERAALMRAPHIFTEYLQDLGSLFHVFYTKCRVIGEDENLSKARLFLSDCTRLVLKKGLSLIGVEAPESM
ncbi:MAG: DALR anticodon-binding domain-containing protein, partial [Candidatus Subteraquimicrobiales bacterium]|nr:DALR anticodon-binding domain-containing protein [Candidatus Subteraquimicrobiales bacterium]